MTDTEKNILIAEFIGLQKQEDGTYFDWDSGESIKPELLNYQSSWDALIHVLNEIANRTGYELVLYSSFCYWNNMGEDLGLGELPGGTSNIKGTYEAIVKFVENHENENTQN